MIKEIYKDKDAIVELRWGSLFRPIQAHNYREVPVKKNIQLPNREWSYETVIERQAIDPNKYHSQDYANYFLSPLMDLAFEVIYAIDLVINLINLLLSLLQVVYYFSMSANDESNYEEESEKSLSEKSLSEKSLEELGQSLAQTIINLIALLNPLLSLLSWLSRPIASIVEAVKGEDMEGNLEQSMPGPNSDYRNQETHEGESGSSYSTYNR